MSKNNNGQTPMELVPCDNVNRFEILKMFAPFQQCQADFPVDSYTKIFFCGNTSIGKSSLTAIIMERANKPESHEYDTSKCVTVEPLTTGIDAHTFTSHEVGNVILYDFAGHAEYYSSHAAVLENFKLILSNDCLEANISTSVPLPFDEFQFFPALVNAEPPTDIKNIENGLGWCLWCPDCLCTSNEYMIAPNEVANARTLNVCQRTLYSFEDVAVGVLTKVDIKEPNNIHIEDIVGSKDPFFRIAPLVTKALFDPSNAELPVQQDYLQHIEDMCGVSFLYTVECTYASIREHCSQFSIFAGCNPLVSYYFFLLYL